jgi:hypothetical protein
MGAEGRKGATGAQGHTGMDGYSLDVTGITGGVLIVSEFNVAFLSHGKNGRHGRDGRDGEDGQKGDPGRDGAQGRDGRDGKDGRAGVDGLNGADGRDGVEGRDGARGAPGEKGEKGSDGAPGRQGDQGEVGVQGLTGKSGGMFIPFWFNNPDGVTVGENLDRNLAISYGLNAFGQDGMTSIAFSATRSGILTNLYVRFEAESEIKGTIRLGMWHLPNENKQGEMVETELFVEQTIDNNSSFSFSLANITDSVQVLAGDQLVLVASTIDTTNPITIFKLNAALELASEN